MMMFPRLKKVLARARFVRGRFAAQMAAGDYRRFLERQEV
jgi:hypothetical protein